jgi:putative endonuclease
MRFQACAVYLLGNFNQTVLYTGVTNDLVRRVLEHRERKSPTSFTARYRVNRLVYFETFDDIGVAIEREKQIKGWSRRKKNALIARTNPRWDDLWPSLVE